MDRDETRAHRMVCAHRPLACAVARQHAPYRAEVQDYRQAALLGLVEAARSFEPGRGVPFGAFARKHAIGRVLRLAHSARNASLEREAAEQYPQERVAQPPAEPEPGLATSVGQFVQSLPPREREFTREVFWRGRSPAEAARQLGFTRARGSAIMRSVRRKGKVVLRDLADLVCRL